MRAMTIVLILAGLLGGSLFWWLTANGPGLDLDLPTEDAPAVVAEIQADPLRADRTAMDGGTDQTGRTAPGAPNRNGTGTGVAITFQATEAQTDRPLTGFTFALTRRGAQPSPIEVVTDRHTLRVGAGQYQVTARKPGFEPPATEQLTITTTSEPATVKLLFRAISTFASITVLDSATLQPLPEYRATVQVFRPGTARPKTEFLPNLRQQPLVLPADRGQRLVVTVEAPGYRPAKPLEIVFEDDQPKPERTVYLTRQMKFAGIELRVTDPSLRPISRLNVVVHQRQPGGRDKPLWNRTTAAADGRYRLPDLAPGRYRFDLASVDAHDNPTLHLPKVRELEFFDGQHIIEPITLQAGAMIELRLTDHTGRSIGKNVWIELTHPDGEVHESLWRHTIDGKPDLHAGLAADKLTQDAPARLYRCLPAGRYSLALRWGRGPQVIRALDLRGGQRHTVDVQLTR